MKSDVLSILDLVVQISNYIFQFYSLLFCWLQILGYLRVLSISGQYLVLKVSLTDCRYTFEPHHGRICDTAKESRLWSLKFSVKYRLEPEHLLRNLCLVTFIYVNLLIKKINKNMKLKKGIFFFQALQRVHMNFNSFHGYTGISRWGCIYQITVKHSILYMHLSRLFQYIFWVWVRMK